MGIKVKEKDLGFKRPKYIKLKTPADALAYVQQLVNSIRYKGLELDPKYIGKIIYLLNTWLNAYRVYLESEEIAEIKERLNKIELEYKDGFK